MNITLYVIKSNNFQSNTIYIRYTKALNRKMCRVFIRPLSAIQDITKGGLMNLVQIDDGFTLSRELLLLICSTYKTCVESDE